MPQALPGPYMPDIGQTINAARTGEADRLAKHQRGVLQQAGKQAAQGSLGDARKSLMSEGMFKEAEQISQMIRQASADQKAQIKQKTDVVANAALAADTPEKWAQTIQSLNQAGIDTTGFEDFQMRDVALAQAGMVKDALDLEIKQQKAGTPLVNIVNQGQTKYAETRGKLRGERMNELETQADAATELATQFEQIGNLLNDPNVYTGTGGGAVQALKKAGTTLFGLDLEGVPEAEAAAKIQKAAVGKVREMAGDTRMSDADRKFYEETIPNISDSPRGIGLTIELTKQLANHKRATAEKALEIEAANGGVMNSKGWSELRRWQKRQSVFDPATMEAARAEAQKIAPRGPDAGLDKLRKKYGLE